MIGLGLSINTANRTLATQVSAIFRGNGYDGFMYDVNDISTLNQVSTGTTPVSAVTQPIGLMLDKHLGLQLGSELVTNGGFSTDTAWTKNAAATISGGKLNTGAIAGVASIATQAATFVVGKTYEITFTIEAIVGNASFFVGGVTGTLQTSPGTYTEKIVATTANSSIAINSRGVGITSGTFDNISVKLLDGNHALQATAAARPTWTNRVNLLTYSEDFSNATWASFAGGAGGAAVKTPNYGLAPDGTSTACRVQVALNGGTASTDYSALNSNANVAVIPYTNSWYVKTTDGTTKAVTLRIAGAGAGDVVTVTGEWQRLSTSYAPGSINSSSMAIGLRGGIGCSDSADILIWHPQLEYGTTATRYQRVTTATDFDTAGFPYYANFDIVDDSLSCATGGGGSAGFFFCVALKPTGGAGTLRTLFSDAGTNTGYKVQIDANNKLSLSVGDNTAYTTKVSTATVDVNTTYLLTVWDDGTNLNVQINAAAAETAARPVVVAGTAGYTLFKDNGAASSFAKGDEYRMIYVKNSGLTAAQRSAIQAWVKAGAGL